MKGQTMCARRTVGILCVALMVTGVALVAGCGSVADVYIAGNEYLCDDQVHDSRSIEFKPDGTFVYEIVAVEGSGVINGTHEVEGDKVTAVFEKSERITNLSEHTIEYKILYEGKHIVDPDGINWYKR